jgi:hypothetical protein
VKNPRDFLIGVALVAFSMLVYAMTLGLPAYSFRMGLSPASFPRALAFVIAVLSTVLVVQGFVRDGKISREPFVGPLFPQMLGFFLIVLSYVIVIPQIGYALSTFLFLALSNVLLMTRRSLKNVAIGLVFAIFAAPCVYYIFGIFLSVPLIEGPVDQFLRDRILGLACGG